MSPPPPIVLRPDQVPEDLVCSICMSISINPKITPCEHVFCNDCIRQSLGVSRCCPIDRRECSIRQTRPLEGCLLRIWGNTQVKCGNGGCNWTGGIGDYSNHIGNCDSGNNPGTQQEVEDLKRKIASLKQKNTELKQKLKDRPNVPRLFHGEYNYRRENVVELSQLISRYLENRPSDIDPNRIYNCVKLIYEDYDRGYSDNPEHYYVDVKMLLATCQASSWFSSKQRDNMSAWFSKHF